MSSRRSGRTSGASALRDAPSSPDDSNISVNVKTSGSRSRQAARGASSRRAEKFEGGEIVTGTRNRGGRKNYVIDDSSPDDDDEEEEEAEIDDAEEDDDDVDEDAEGEEMEVDAEGEDIDAEGEEDAEGEDADGDVDMGVRTAPTIRVSHSSSTRPAARVAASKIVADDEDEDDEEDDDDDEELSDPGESDGGDQTMGFGDETMADEDEDAEGEEIEVAGEEEDEEEVEEEEVEGGEPRAAGIDSDEDGSGDGSPKLDKMTKRQRARFEDEPQEYMKLSDEVQAKKQFTAEELSMRRQEMARRRRNLSEKRTEEVKMETINKLLKKQAPKINRKAAAAARDELDEEKQKADPLFIRWVSSKAGVRVSVPEEIVTGPAGRVVFGKAAGGGPASGKMVEEVS